MLKEALEMSNNYKAKKTELTNLLLKNEELDDELTFLDEQIVSMASFYSCLTRNSGPRAKQATEARA